MINFGVKNVIDIANFNINIKSVERKKKKNSFLFYYIAGNNKVKK